MKKIKCNKMVEEDTCELEITAENAKEMIDIGWKHLQEAHPEVAERIMKNPKDENDKWMKNFEDSVFPRLEEVTA